MSSALKISQLPTSLIRFAFVYCNWNRNLVFYILFLEWFTCLWLCDSARCFNQDVDISTMLTWLIFPSFWHIISNCTSAFAGCTISVLQLIEISYNLQSVCVGWFASRQIIYCNDAGLRNRSLWDIIDLHKAEVIGYKIYKIKQQVSVVVPIGALDL